MAALRNEDLDEFVATQRDITGVPLPLDANEPDQLMALWKYQHSVEADPVRAWGSVVSAVLRDPLVLFY